jgi:hypothetical protein
MLDFAVKYRTAIGSMISNREFNLRKCEWGDDDGKLQKTYVIR